MVGPQLQVMELAAGRVVARRKGAVAGGPSSGAEEVVSHNWPGQRRRGRAPLQLAQVAAQRKGAAAAGSGSGAELRGHRGKLVQRHEGVGMP